MARPRRSARLASATSTLPRISSDSSRPVCQGACHSRRPSKCSISSSGMPAASIFSTGVPSSSGLPVAGQVGLLAVDHHRAAGLVDVGGLAHQARVRAHRVLAPARTSRRPRRPPGCRPPAPAPGSARSCRRHRERASRAAPAGCRRGRCRRSAGSSPATVSAALPWSVWRLGDSGEDLELDFPPPLTAGIVNVTTDSFFSGARSGTPEQAVADGLRLVAAGFGMLDVGAVAARSGPPVTPQVEAEKLVPAIAGLVERCRLCRSPPTPSPPRSRGRALAAGAVAVNDISGGADPEMFEVVAEAGCGYVLMHIEGPPRVDRPAPRLRRRGRVPEALVLASGSRRLVAAGVAERGDRDRSRPGLRSDGRRRHRDRAPPRRAGGTRAARSTPRSRARTSSARSSPARGRSESDADERGAGQLRGGGARGRRRRLDPPRARRRIARRDHGRRGDRATASHARRGARERPLENAWRNVIALGADDGRLVAASTEEPRLARSRIPFPRDLPKALTGPLRASGIDSLYAHQNASARRRARRQLHRHQRHRVGQVARLQPAGARAASPRSPSGGRSTSTRPRRWPRTRRESSTSCGCPSCATRSTTATRRARSGRRSGAAPTSS